MNSSGKILHLEHETTPPCLPILIRVLDYERLLLAPSITFLPLTAPVFERAASIRASHKDANGRRYSVQDSLHLAAAVQSGCTSFLTNDLRLAGFSDIAIDVLP